MEMTSVVDCGNIGGRKLYWQRPGSGRSDNKGTVILMDVDDVSASEVSVIRTARKFYSYQTSKQQQMKS